MIPLVRVIGRRRAMDMLLSGRFISAEEAVQFGLVNKVVQPEKLGEETRDWALELAQASPFVLGPRQERPSTPGGPRRKIRLRVRQRSHSNELYGRRRLRGDERIYRKEKAGVEKVRSVAGGQWSEKESEQFKSFEFPVLSGLQFLHPPFVEPVPDSDPGGGSRGILKAYIALETHAAPWKREGTVNRRPCDTVFPCAH